MAKSPSYILGMKSHIVKHRKKIKNKRQIITLCGKVKPVTSIAIAKQFDKATCEICAGVYKSKAQHRVAGLLEK